MGVPAFFRWLSKKYPAIVVNAVEQGRTVENTSLPVDATQPNPNFQEFDNLYLDMNGIIHPCTHPEDRPPPKTEEEMFLLIFEYIDRLFSFVRPRRILYMAIDGVAPRAKMNQQRSRRFRASKEAADKAAEIAAIRSRLESEGVPLPPPKPKEEHFDSNCITPGTPFMARLAVALRYYIHLRVTNDPAWYNVQVILSDANAPGEGEHKIMDFIRKQRASPSHDPNTVHCLCGADADLIMLGLATHEINFNVVREEFVPNQPRPCELCFQFGHELKDCKGLITKDDNPDLAPPASKAKNFIFIRLPVLREYLERDLQMPNLPFHYDLERAIDDWVFLCFFVGNDFLPHLPSLEIREGAIDRLIKIYKDVIYSTRGWLTENGKVFGERVELIMKELGRVEDKIFRDRQNRELRFRDDKKRRRQQENKTRRPAYLPAASSIIAPCAPGDAPNTASGAEARQQAADARREGMQLLDSLFKPAGTKRGHAEGDEEMPAPKSFKEGAESTNSSAEQPWREVKRKPPPPPRKGDDDEDSEPEDSIRLWEEGWKDRYYREKFGVPEIDIEFRRKVAWAYTEGLCWVLKYYYQGCASWDWYYPYHYAPFASDFDTVAKFKPNFSKPTQPFNPLEQLMSVFPAASKSHIPAGWRDLMTSADSPIYEFYPKDFKIDLNGKKFAWQGVALLPFVDEKLLLTTLKTVYHTLTTDEKARNIIGPDRIFVGRHHKLFDALVEVHESGVEGTRACLGYLKKAAACLDEKANPTEPPKWVTTDPALANGMAGQVCYDAGAAAPHTCYRTLFRGAEGFGDIENNGCIMAAYKEPNYDRGFIFLAKRNRKAKTPERMLKPHDWDDRRDGNYRPMLGFTRYEQREGSHRREGIYRPALGSTPYQQRDGNQRRDGNYRPALAANQYPQSDWNHRRDGNYRPMLGGVTPYQQPDWNHRRDGNYRPPPMLNVTPHQQPAWNHRRDANHRPMLAANQYQQLDPTAAAAIRQPQQQAASRLTTNIYGAPSDPNAQYGGYRGFFG